MTRAVSFPGRRPALSQPGQPLAATWVSNGGRQLVVARLGEKGGKAELAVLRAEGRERFAQPSIQSVGRGDVAVAWGNGDGPAARVEVAILRPLANGSLKVLSSFRTGSGEGEPDLSRTSGGRLLLATTRSSGGLAVRSLSTQRLRETTPLVINGDNPADPQLTRLSAGGLSGGLLYSTGSGIRLALLGEGRSRPELRREVEITGNASDKGPAVSSDGQGLVAMSWAQRDASQENFDVMVRSFSVGSNRLGSIRRAHADATAEQRDPMLAVQPDGLVRVVWRDQDRSRQGLATSLHRISDSGEWRRLDEKSLATRGSDPDVSSSREGQAVFSWSAGGGNGEKVNLLVENGSGAKGLQERPQSKEQRAMNEIRASLQKDRLRATSRSDVFVFPTRSHSLIDRYDVIIGYGRSDLIDDHHARRNVKVDPITNSAGRINDLNRAELNRVCKASNGYGVYGAVAFMVKGEPGVWLAINDRRSGFQEKSDPILHLQDFSPSARNPITII
jgi:hypothetical protein